jgi:hypothetical protein
MRRGCVAVRSWGERAAEVIAGVIAEHRGAPEAEMRGHIAAAYPFGERRLWPYRAWLKAVRIALHREYGTGEGTRCAEERQPEMGL